MLAVATRRLTMHALSMRGLTMVDACLYAGVFSFVCNNVGSVTARRLENARDNNFTRKRQRLENARDNNFKNSSNITKESHELEASWMPDQ